MIVIRDPADTYLIGDPDIRMLVDLRFRQCFPEGDYDPKLHGFFVVAQPGDTVAALEKLSPFPLLQDPFSGAVYGEPEFSKMAEATEVHHGHNGSTFFSLLFVTSDDGYGVEFFIPAIPGINSTLLLMLAESAQPAVTA